MSTTQVPANLKNRFKEIILKHEDIWDTCPSGHDIQVSIKISFVSQGGGCVLIRNKKQYADVYLQEKIGIVVAKSITIQGACPYGHEVCVRIEITYVSKYPNINLYVEVKNKKQPRGPRMIVSNEVCTDEYFEALLAAPFKQYIKRFITFFKDNGNTPMTPIQWRKKGFLRTDYRRVINRLCWLKRIPVAFVHTGDYDINEKIFSPKDIALYKFCVLESKTRIKNMDRLD